PRLALTQQRDLDLVLADGEAGAAPFVAAAGRRGREQLGLLTQHVEPLALLVHESAVLRELLRDAGATRRAVLTALLGLELALHDFTRELVVRVRDANVELRDELRKRRLHLALPLGERFAFVLELTNALLGSCELFVHFTNRVLEQHVGF